MQSENKDLLEEFRAYTSTDENSNRVGEFAIGTNTACTHVIGHILQDEKIPGVHIAFGHPYAEHTGANWVSKTHIDCVGRDFDIWFDGDQVMQRREVLGLILLKSRRRGWSFIRDSMICTRNDAPVSTLISPRRNTRRWCAA